MKIILIMALLSISSCKWLDDRALTSWTSETVDTLLEMSLRKSMIGDTPLKTMEALENAPGVKLSASKLCRCAAETYGGILGVVANNVKESSVKSICKSMSRCYFNSKAPVEFKGKCFEYFKDGKFKKLAKDRNNSLKRFTKARRILSSYCSKI